MALSVFIMLNLTLLRTGVYDIWSCPLDEMRVNHERRQVAKRCRSEFKWHSVSGVLEAERGYSGDARDTHKSVCWHCGLQVGEDGAPPVHRDIVIYPRGRQKQRILYISCHLDPLVYPLLFPNREKAGTST